ncbi:MAG: hypothetical protein U0787_08235 [Polyangia bacterium]
MERHPGEDALANGLLLLAPSITDINEMVGSQICGIGTATLQINLDSHCPSIAQWHGNRIVATRFCAMVANTMAGSAVVFLTMVRSF